MYDIARIQQEMVRQFMSTRALAKKARVAAVTVTRLFETGRANPETIGKLVRALKLNPDDVVKSDVTGSGGATEPTERHAAVAKVGPVELPEPRTSEAEHELVESVKEKRHA